MVVMRVTAAHPACHQRPAPQHLVVAGHAAPWDGSEGQLQQRIGVESACDLTRRYLHWGIDVVLSDVLNSETAVIGRSRLSQKREW